MNPKNRSAMENLPVPLLSGGSRSVARRFTTFGPWAGPKVERTWNKSPLVEYEGKGPFAELALLGLLEKEDREGVWVYRARKFTDTWHPVLGPVPRTVPEEVLDLYRRVSARCEALCRRYSVRSGGGGCWDILAWKGNEILFAKAKRRNKDSLQDSQCGWLEAALEESVRVRSLRNHSTNPKRSQG